MILLLIIFGGLAFLSFYGVVIAIVFNRFGFKVAALVWLLMSPLSLGFFYSLARLVKTI